MKQQMRLTIVASLALISLLHAPNQIQARPPARRQSNGLPDLSETLAVAKSPYEPVTLAASSPGARNGEPAVAGDGLAEEAPKVESLVSTTIERKQSTRAAQDEQESDTKAASETSDSDSLRSTQSIESTTPAEITETDGLGSTNESDAETSTTPKTENSVTTEAAPVTESTTTAQPTRSADSSESTTTTTTSSPTEDTSELPSTTTTTISTTTTTAVGTNEESKEPSTTKSSVTTESNAKDQPEVVTNSVEKEQSETPSTASSITTTTTTSFTLTETPEATTQAPSSTQASTETSTTEAPSSVSPAATTEQTTPASSTPVDEPKEAKEETSKGASCNHLPNYDEDEIQKVFREETTYKNGTIKGKFTYINFDQRYRLVHYTRLPYGPVKIDQVEELGKPEQNGTTSGGSTSAEIPNSVLQLRNILPNSLFGFPFLGPSGANKPLEPREGSPVGGNRNEAPNNDRSNTYFYSTDSLSTPNLLSPSVPVSLLPGRNRIPRPPLQTPSDTFGQSYYENLPVGNPQQSAETIPRKYKPQTPDRLQAIEEQRQSTFGSPDLNQLRFQYALASQMDSSSHPKQEGLVYNYGSQPQTQYQYSPVPVYAFPQPTYLSSQRQPPISQTYSSFQGSSRMMHSQDQNQDATSFSTYQSHQPHSHEHFVAPFMYAQPAAGSSARLLDGDNLTERPKLKLKTAKTSSIRQESGSIKSAQLRSPSRNASYSSPVNSPVQVHKMQHRQRSGKQNHELKPAYNSSPIVYHVLRSPVGRMYNVPDYHQSHSMAYERDD